MEIKENKLDIKHIEISTAPTENATENIGKGLLDHSLYLFIFFKVFVFFSQYSICLVFQESKNKDNFCGVVSVIPFNFVIVVNFLS